MQLNTASNFTVVRQIANHTDTATYYVRAVIRNAYTDTILDTLDLTDKGSQRFKKDWKVPADPSGQGFYISIITSVYEDSGYTTKSASYGDEENTYLVADRMLGKGGGMGVSFGISDIRRVIKEELDKVEKPEPMKMPEMPKMKWEEVLSAISEIKDNAKEIQNNITEIPQTDLTPIHNHLSKIEKAVEDKPITPETDLTDIKEQLRKNTDAVMSVLEEAGASIVRIAQKSIREELGKVKWGYISSFMGSPEGGNVPVYKEDKEDKEPPLDINSLAQ